MNEINVRAQLIAQSYLLEMLLMNLVKDQPAPVQVLEQMRFWLAAQLNADAPRWATAAGSDAEGQSLVHAATSQLETLLDRVAGQFENPRPTLHSA